MTDIKNAEAKREQLFRRPIVDVYEDADGVILQFELPGIPRDDIKVTVEDDILRVETATDFSNQNEGDALFREYEAANFAREFTLSRSLDTANVHASWADGVLVLKIPKAAETKPRKIAISQN